MRNPSRADREGLGRGMALQIKGNYNGRPFHADLGVGRSVPVQYHGVAGRFGPDPNHMRPLITTVASDHYVLSCPSGWALKDQRAGRNARRVFCRRKKR